MIKSFETFDNDHPSQQWICEFLHNHNISKFRIKEEKVVDVYEDVIISDINLFSIPIKFGKVLGNFDCSMNSLKNLKGSPRIVEGGFYCDRNQLKNLEGCPEKVGGEFWCNENYIMNFSGISDYSINPDRDFFCEDNPVFEVYRLFHQTAINTKCIDLLNEYDVIQGDKIILVRLEEVFHLLEMEVPEDLESLSLEYYKIVS